MSYPYETTIDTPAQIAIHPDWAQGVVQGTRYRTEIQQTRAGMEQRTQHRLRPILTMEYTTTPEAAEALERVATQTRGPILTPWWPHGLKLAVPMPSDTEITLSSAPIASEWDRDGWVYLWNRSIGGEFRQIDSRLALTITLTGTGTTYPAGSWAFPVRLATRAGDEAMLQARKARATAREKVIFQTL